MFWKLLWATLTNKASIVIDWFSDHRFHRLFTPWYIPSSPSFLREVWSLPSTDLGLLNFPSYSSYICIHVNSPGVFSFLARMEPSRRRQHTCTVLFHSQSSSQKPSSPLEYPRDEKEKFRDWWPEDLTIYEGYHPPGVCSKAFRIFLKAFRTYPVRAAKHQLLIETNTNEKHLTYSVTRPRYASINIIVSLCTSQIEASTSPPP